ncbi:MAG: SpoIIE family protein phosphatase [Clostridia bacterium]|nr:SpoIIE family protein phosphatase [Clostridia bacterium]
MNKRYYKKILDEITTAVVIVDGKMKVRFINDAFRKLFPYAGIGLDLGKAAGCAASTGACGACAKLPSCDLHRAFTKSRKMDGEISSRISLDVRGDGDVRGVTFPLTVRPLGKKLCLGVIDPSSEYLARLRLAADIQQRFLPTHNFVASKLYSFIYKPLNEISGDIIETFDLGGRACAMVADVSGKDVSAGMLSQFVKGAYNTAEMSPAKAIAELRERFCELSADERNYITVAAVRIDDDSLTYSMAGHNAPILIKSKNGITRIFSNSPPVSNWFDSPSYYEDTVPYSTGDILVMLTDGVTECRNTNGETFGADSVVRVLSVSNSASDFISRLDAALTAFCPSPGDDITAIAFDL